VSYLKSIIKKVKNNFIAEKNQWEQRKRNEQKLAVMGENLGRIWRAFDGEKYPGGLSGIRTLRELDYRTLRNYSYTLFVENKYAAGLIKRLVTNVIHTGLTLEAGISGKILGLEENVTNELIEEIELKYDIWGNDAELVSKNGEWNSAQMQRLIYQHALISGDILVISYQNATTGLPQQHLLDGANVCTPEELTDRQDIRLGVEVDQNNRHLAYYVKDLKAKKGYQRVPAWGEKSGRRVAWLAYTEKLRISDVRGMPALGIILQGLKNLDRFSDAESAAAWLNATLALFVKNESGKPSSKPLSGSAVQFSRQPKSTVGTEDEKIVFPERKISKLQPNIILEDLQQGEEPVSFSTQRPNVNFGVFEAAMMDSFAWVKGIPPSIYRLAYSHNYAASGLEVNDLKMFLQQERELFTEQSGLKIIYQNWLISMCLTERLQLPKFLEILRDPAKIFEKRAYLNASWAGTIKPSLKMLQDVQMYKLAVDEGFVTRSQASKALFNVRFSTVIKRLKKENENFVEAVEILQEAGLIKDENKQIKYER